MVVASNYRHYEHWCRSVQLNPNDHKSVNYLSSPYKLYGLLGSRDMEIVMLPEWYYGRKSDDVDKIDMLVKEHWKRRKVGDT